VFYGLALRGVEVCEKIGGHRHLTRRILQKPFAGEILVEGKRIPNSGFPHDQETYFVNEAESPAALEETLHRGVVQGPIHPADEEWLRRGQERAGGIPSAPAVKEDSGLEDDVVV
jgi:hypothetical protein